MKEPGPITALLVALAVAVMYTHEQTRVFAGLILLAVLLTPAHGQPSMLQGLLQYLNQLLTEGINTGG